MGLKVTVAEADGEAEGHMLADCEALRVRVRVTVPEPLRLRVGEPLELLLIVLDTLGESELEPERLGEGEGEGELLCVAGPGVVAAAPRMSRSRKNARILMFTLAYASRKTVSERYGTRK